MDNDLVKELYRKIQMDFELVRTELIVNRDLWNDFQTAELFLKILAVRNYLLCPQGMEQIATLSEDEQLQLYAATDMYQSVCNLIDETGYDFKAGPAVAAYCEQFKLKQPRKEDTDDQRGIAKKKGRTLS